MILSTSDVFKKSELVKFVVNSMVDIADYYLKPEYKAIWFMQLSICVLSNNVASGAPLSTSRINHPLWMFGANRKIRPSGSLFVLRFKEKPRDAVQ